MSTPFRYYVASVTTNLALRHGRAKARPDLREKERDAKAQRSVNDHSAGTAAAGEPLLRWPARERDACALALSARVGVGDGDLVARGEGGADVDAPHDQFLSLAGEFISAAATKRKLSAS